jgi:hypothetical protein
MPGENHDWLNLDHYLAIHERCMAQAEENFVVAHDLLWSVVVAPHMIRFRGIVRCHGELEIHVDKTLDRDRLNRVKGRRYSYQALIAGVPPVRIFRYDNADHFRNHPDAFHRHRFDSVGREIAVEHAGRQNWPTLLDVIDELYDWWRAHVAKD